MHTPLPTSAPLSSDPDLLELMGIPRALLDGVEAPKRPTIVERRGWIEAEITALADECRVAVAFDTTADRVRIGLPGESLAGAESESSLWYGTHTRAEAHTYLLGYRAAVGVLLAPRSPLPDSDTLAGWLEALRANAGKSAYTQWLRDQLTDEL